MLSLFVRVIHAPLYEIGMLLASRTKKKIGTQVLSEVTPESCVLSASILLEQNVSLQMPLFHFSQWFNMTVTCCYSSFASITLFLCSQWFNMTVTCYYSSFVSTTCNFTCVFSANIGSPILLHRNICSVPLPLFLVTILLEPNTVKTFQLLCGREFTVTSDPTLNKQHYSFIIWL